MFMIVVFKKHALFSRMSTTSVHQHKCPPGPRDCFPPLAFAMMRLCAVTLNPFISDVESFNSRAGPCHGLCERTRGHSKLWRLRGSLLFIAYPALRCLMAARCSSPPLLLLRSQIMIRKDANGKEYNDYQLQHRSVYQTGWPGLIGCDTELHLMFVMLLKKLTSSGLHAHTGWTHFSHPGPRSGVSAAQQRKKVQEDRKWWIYLLLLLVYVMNGWRNVWQPWKQQRKETLCCSASHII